MTTLETLRAKRAELESIARKYGVHNIRVFGSVVRGEERLDSDVDLLVDVEKGRSLIDVIAFKQDAEALFGCAVDVLSARGIHPLLKPYIMEEVMPL